MYCIGNNWRAEAKLKNMSTGFELSAKNQNYFKDSRCAGRITRGRFDS
jgi:hypothetical protein